MRARLAKVIFLAFFATGFSLGALAADWPLRTKTFVEEPVKERRAFFVHAGIAGIALTEGASMTLGGAAITGGTIKVEPQVTVIVEAGYYLNENWAISLTAGWPPRAQIHPAGTIASFGKLGIATYGPATLTVHYHFKGFGRFQPYIGAGPTFLIGIRNQDRLIQNLDLQNSIGFAGQIGFDYMINDRWGVFLDVKKAYLRSKATGTIGGAPVIAKVKLDPLVVSTGITYRF